MDLTAIEKTGPNYSVEKLLEARRKTATAVSLIAERIKPGMLETEGLQTIEVTLDELGSRSRWHKSLVRFGANTIKTYGDPSEPGVRLRDDDIFFIDIGPVWDDMEGDGGGTFVVGQQADPEMRRCAADVMRIFAAVRNEWATTSITGKQLYDLASKRADELGWVLNLGLTGHRLSEVSHKNYFAGTLGMVNHHPSPNLWILEIQIGHPHKPIGGFFEDLLLA